MNRRSLLKTCVGVVVGAVAALVVRPKPSPPQVQDVAGDNWYKPLPNIQLSGCVPFVSVCVPCDEVDKAIDGHALLAQKHLEALADGCRGRIGRSRKILALDLGRVPLYYQSDLYAKPSLSWSYRTEYLLDHPQGIPYSVLMNRLLERTVGVG